MIHLVSKLHSQQPAPAYYAWAYSAYVHWGFE